MTESWPVPESGYIELVTRHGYEGLTYCVAQPGVDPDDLDDDLTARELLKHYPEGSTLYTTETLNHWAAWIEVPSDG